MYKSEHIVLSISSLVKLENLDHDERKLCSLVSSLSISLGSLIVMLIRIHYSRILSSVQLTH